MLHWNRTGVTLTSRSACGIAMGVPSFYRWLSEKYPRVVTDAIIEEAALVDGVEVPVDTTKPNPNSVEFDNLFLDMNGLIHPCCHPEDKPRPRDEDEMIANVFLYLDKILAIVRPRRLLYMAIDGVAPRAKMNQQRARRFRAAQEMQELETREERLREQWRREGKPLPPKKAASWDHNAITPGTPFMAKLAQGIRWYIQERLSNNPAWKNVSLLVLFGF